MKEGPDIGRIAALIGDPARANMWLRRGRLAGLVFYGLFALAITASVQLVGVYLVFASLIVPALATAGMMQLEAQFR